MRRIDEIVAGWEMGEETAERVVHIEQVPGRGAIWDPLEPPPGPGVVERLSGLGVGRLYRHQVAGINAVRRGEHTVVVAGTASGKSLVYQLPIAEAVAADHATTALALYPTKALTQDQLRVFSRLGTDDLVAATYDGDTEVESRRWVRAKANVVLTNPDMLHIGILPHHARWEHFFRHLEFVVVDELHVFRGIFGSHVAHVLRRLRRIAAHYGSRPTFVFTSATIGNPGELATALSGLEVTVIDQDTSPQGSKTYVLWNPEIEDPERGIRASPMGEASRIFGALVTEDVPTIVFSRSRKASELMYRWARDRLDPERAKRISPYRAGYLASERRRIETALFSGELLGVVATNALELGIDVGGLDAAVITTFPGTIASFRQQAGRAGRALDDSLAVLVAGQDALDQYYMNHPEDLFGRRPETAVINPDNPQVLEGHVGCAAHEIPLVPDDREFLGEAFEETAAELVARGDLGFRQGRLFWAGGGSPAGGIDIRTTGGRPYTISDQGGTLLGTIDENRAFSQCHEGAVYLHQGDSYVVETLNQELGEIRVRRGEVGYYTQAKIDKDLSITARSERLRIGDIAAQHGEVEVVSQVLAYQRKEIRTGKVLDTTTLDLPPRTLRTQAVWYTFPDSVIVDAGITMRDLPGTLHAAEHTAIAVLPLFAICDRWDIGGLSIAVHPQTGEPTFFIYDGYPGGAGIAPIAFEHVHRHLRATLATLDDCNCRDGCPSCVQSPKCGNFNEPLDKDGAAALLRMARAAALLRMALPPG